VKALKRFKLFHSTENVEEKCYILQVASEHRKIFTDVKKLLLAEKLQ
jgi:hypothetical protein